MSDDSIHQPHDKLFKAGFSDPQNAAGLLRAELPEAIAAQIDWDLLRLEPGSFVDSHYRNSESDLLFSAPLGGSDEGGECLLYILFEHQISQDAMMALRLLRYMVRIWEARVTAADVGTGEVKLPVILPVVLAQNAEVWELSPHFSDLLHLPVELEESLSSFVPDFSFQLLQLAKLPFDEIRGTPAGIMILRTMKAERLQQLLGEHVWDEALLVELPTEMKELVLRYILGADVDMEAFDRRVLGIATTELRNSTMTLADQLRADGLQKGLEKGRQQGRQEGRQEGIQLAILGALEIRFGAVPDGLRSEVAAVRDSDHLRRLQEASIQSASLEDFAKGL